MNNRAFSMLSVLAAVSLAGCALPMDMDSDPGSVPQGPPTFRQRLSGREALAVELAPAAVEVNAVGGDDQPQSVSIDVSGGALTLRATDQGDLWLETLAVELADASLPADLVPPDGARLTDIRVTLDHVTGGPARWEADGSSAMLEADADLALDWNVRFADGDAHPLATVHVRDVSFALAVELTGDGVQATLAGGRPGPLWSWADWFKLSDLAIELNAREAGSGNGA